MPIAIIASLVVCTVIYIAVAARAHRHAALDPARHRRAAGHRLLRPAAWAGRRWSSRSARCSPPPRCCSSSSSASRASSSRWRATACCRRGRPRSTRKYRTPHVTTWITGIVVAVLRRRRQHQRGRRADQHRHAVRVRAGLHRRHRPALQGPGPAAAVPRAGRRLAGADARRRLLHLPDGLPAAGLVVAVHRLAGAGHGGLLRLRLQPQRGRPARRAGRHESTAPQKLAALGFLLAGDRACSSSRTTPGSAQLLREARDAARPGTRRAADRPDR